MATSNSTTNLITMTASGDTARSGQKLRIAGVLALTTSVTAAAGIRLQDGAGTLDIIPSSKAESGAGIIIDSQFKTPIEVTGLKATSCANAIIRVQLR